MNSYTSCLRRFGFIAMLGISAVAMVTGTPDVAEAKATCPAGYPNKPIHFYVGSGAGGGTDVIARAIAMGLEKIQGWTVVPENRPGNSGGVLAVWLKSRPADGYAISVTSTDAVTVVPAEADSGYSWEDFEYLGSGMQTWSGMVALADRPYNDLSGLIAYAKDKGRATISVSGVNQVVLVKQLAEEFKVNLIAIPGTGAAEAMASALGGHVDATTQGTLHVAQIKAGKMKQLVSVIDRRVPYAPGNGTLAEQGSKATPLDSHTILMAPKGLNPDIKSCLKQAIDEAVKSADYKALMDKFENEALNLGEEGNINLIKRTAAFYKDTLKKK